MSTYVFDIEGNGLLDTIDTIHSIVLKDVDTLEVISCADQPGYVPLKDGLGLMTEADHLIGHNILKYDFPALKIVYPDIEFLPDTMFKTNRPFFDTLLCSRLIWTDLKDRDFKLLAKFKKQEQRGQIESAKEKFPGNMLGRHGLEGWGYRLGLHKGDYAKEMKAKGLDPWAQWSPEMQEYCELDVEVTYQLYKLIQSKDYSEQAIQLEHEFAELILYQEQFGFPFDEKAAAKLYTKLVGRKLELAEELKEVFPSWEIRTPFTPKVNNKKRGYVKGVRTEKVKAVEFNPGSRDHIAMRLQAQRGWKPTEFSPSGKPTVDEAVLSKLNYPEAKVLCEYLMVQKRIGQLGDGANAWLKLCRDGRIYGEVVTNGAVTGRCTHKKPNVAQTPRCTAPYGEECRALFTAPEGYVLVGADASSLELRCLAHYLSPIDGGIYAKEVHEGDIHTTNQSAAVLPTRDDAKTFIYAFLYGAGDGKIGEIVGGGSKQGALLKKRFMAAIPAVRILKEKISKRVKAKGFLIGLDGRLLHIRSDHSALNTLLQSAGALIMKQALVILYRDLTACGYIHGEHYAFLANIHDEFQIAAKPDIAEEIGQAAVDAIVKSGEHFNFRCKLDGEYKIGKTWAETH